MTNTSFTEVTAMVSMPFPLRASAFCTIDGTCILWQVPVNAPGTANRATFLSLKISSVVFHAGPSPVITLNLAVGKWSPTLMGMTLDPLIGTGVEPILSLACSGRRPPADLPAHKLTIQAD